MSNSELSRRDFFSFVGKASLAAALLESGLDVRSLAEAAHIRNPIREITLPGISREHYIVHWSDSHMGSTGIDEMNPYICSQMVLDLSIALKTIGAEPEQTTLVFTGDAVNHSGKNETDFLDFAASVRAFEQMNLRRFAVPGNHDINHPLEEYFRNGFEQSGFRVLGWKENDPLIIQKHNLPFQVVGTPDYTTRAEWYESADRLQAMMTALLKDGRPVVWLTHNASVVDVAGWGDVLAENGITALFLSGHTHGGQIGRQTPIQRILHQKALDKVGYDSRFVAGVSHYKKNVFASLSNGTGASRAIVRTAPRENPIYHLMPA